MSTSAQEGRSYESRDCVNMDMFSTMQTRTLRHLYIAEAHQNSYLDHPITHVAGPPMETTRALVKHWVANHRLYGKRSTINDELFKLLRRAEYLTTSNEEWHELTTGPKLRCAVEWSTASSFWKPLEICFLGGEPHQGHCERI